MALVLVDYEIVVFIMSCIFFLDEVSLSDVGFKIFPTLKISNFRGMRLLFLRKHRYCYLLRHSFPDQKYFLLYCLLL